MEPPQALFKEITRLDIGIVRPKQLGDLAEELLDRIVACLDPAFTRPLEIDSLRPLANLSMVSRKLHRIVEPHLYRAIPITLNKQVRGVNLRLLQNGTIQHAGIIMTTTEGANATAFLRTMKARPDLVEHVEYLGLARFDWGHEWGILLGFDGYQQDSGPKISTAALQDAIQNDTPLSISNTQPIMPNAVSLPQSVDPAAETVRDILRIVSRVKWLDRSSYITDAPWDPFLEIAKGLSTLPLRFHDFTHLHGLRFHCSGCLLARLWPVFMLPNLRRLHLIGGVLITVASVDCLERWTNIRDSQLQILSIEGALPSSYSQYHHDSNALCLMSTVSVKLQTLDFCNRVKTSRNLLGLQVHAIRYRLETLHHLQMYNTEPQPYMHGVLAALQDPLAYLAPLRNAKALQRLTMDIVNLITAYPIEEVPPDTRGQLLHPFVISPHAGRRIRAVIDLTLPRSLVSLTLRAVLEPVQRDALLDALDGLIDHVPERFPNLRTIKVAWHRAALDTGNPTLCALVPIVALHFRKLGIELCQEFILKGS
jgi:hypothetical protein